MKGMNASTGRAISGLDHLHQSIGKILTTPLATRVKRRAFGSHLADLVDAPDNGTTRVRLYAAIATALMRWEPRLTLTRISLSTDEYGAGHNVAIAQIDGFTAMKGEAFSTRVQLTQGGTA